MTINKKVKRIIGFVLMVVLLFSGYYVYSMFSFLHAVGISKPFSSNESNALATAKWEGTEQVNILVLGVDSRSQEEKPRSDTMLLASINPVTKKASVFSIMRDTYVDIPGVGQSKINAAFANGGPDLLIQTIQEFLGLDIHYYVATDFEGFVKVVDAIGGIDVNVPERMLHADDGKYDIVLEQGQQHLDGRKALMYARYRGGARADFERTERQREVIQIVASELKQPSKLLQMPSILKEVQPYIETNLGSDDLVKLTALAMKIDAGTIKSEQIPRVEHLEETTNMYGEAILWPTDIEAIRASVQETIDGTKTDTTAAGNGTAAGSSSTQTAGTNNATEQQPQAEQPATSPDASVSSEEGPQATVTGEYVNLRRKPGTEHEVIGQVYKGDVLSILDDSFGDWLYVRTPDGMAGYVTASLVQIQ